MSVEFERGLIGALVVDPSLLGEVIGVVSPSDFENRTLRAIFEACLHLRRSHIEIELISICREASIACDPHQVRVEVGRAANEGLPANAVYYARSIRIARDNERRAQLAAEFLSAIQREPSKADDLQAKHIRELRALGGTAHDAIIKPADHIVLNEINRLIEDKQKDRSSCIQTGFDAIDRIAGGLSRCEVTTIAAPTGFGKTSFSMEVAYRIAKQGLKALVVSLEMADSQVAHRYLARISGISVSRLRKYDFALNELREAAEAVRGQSHLCNVSFVLSSRTTIDDIVSITHRFAARSSIDLLIVDYIGRVAKHDRRMDTREHVSDVIGELKNLAIDVQIPVIALAQLNRAGQKEPSLEHLAESSSVERDSDAVWLLSEASEGHVTLALAKNRQGPKGKINLSFDSAKMRWEEPSNDWNG
ncbi:MAG: DnaB-like helicase C-terminal domain-containing protein [Pirellulales bacterium]